MTRMPDLRPIDCTACPIRHRAVCARCDAAELDQLAAIKTYRSFPAGAQIMQRGAAFIVKMEHPPTTAKGQTMWFNAKRDVLHLFDQSSGLRIEAKSPSH